MTSLSTSYIPGFYGKLPVLGDFVSRRLPAGFIQTLDGWLQTAIAASRESIGAGWENAYLASPTWRFVLSPEIYDKDYWAGILMPSVDKVGRYFPLSVAVMIDKAELVSPCLFISGNDWFERLEKLAEAAFKDKLSIDEFDKELLMQDLTLLPPENEISCYEKNFPDDMSRGWCFEMKDLNQISDACIQLNERMRSVYLSKYTLWCTRGSSFIPHSFRVYTGLPPSDFYTELLARHCSDDRDRENYKDNVVPSVVDIEVLQESGQDDQNEIDNDINWVSSACTTVGAVREINEDAFLESPELGLWAVADGMGGHSAGDVASQTAVQALEKLHGHNDIGAFTKEVTECLQRINSELIEKAAGPAPEQIVGSTIVIMLAVGNQCAAIWAGDSRLYRYRDGVLTQLTYDHTQPVKVSIADFFSEEELVDSSQNSPICKALGVLPDLQVDISYFENRAGDMYLLCSDGLDKEVSLREIADIFSQGEYPEIAQKLVDLSLGQGARDNVTVIVIKSEKGPFRSPE